MTVNLTMPCLLTRRLPWSSTPSLLQPMRFRPQWNFRKSYSTSNKLSDPLRILFCGSDDFSCASLHALYREYRRNSALIRSIDVVVRPAKPTGRGYKELREVPVQKLANELGLPVHVRDTFTGWNMPQPEGDPINLIIAVSFGLFVPPRLLSAAKYGGLNVHPSLLPDLRGPAPLHHALLHGDTHTGVSIQTLSPTTFDAGTILSQTPPPGIPIPRDCTLVQLHNLLAPVGAEMLVDVLRQGKHVPPHEDVVENDVKGKEGLRHAPKVEKKDGEVRLVGTPSGRTAARDAVLRERVLGAVWTHVRVPGKKVGDEGVVKRVILGELSEMDGWNAPSELTKGTVTFLQQYPPPSAGSSPEAQKQQFTPVPLTTYFFLPSDAVPKGPGAGAVAVHMPDGSWLCIGRIKVEGSTAKPAAKVMRSLLSVAQ